VGRPDNQLHQPEHTSTKKPAVNFGENSDRHGGRACCWHEIQGITVRKGGKHRCGGGKKRGGVWGRVVPTSRLKKGAIDIVEVWIKTTSTERGQESSDTSLGGTGKNIGRGEVIN